MFTCKLQVVIPIVYENSMYMYTNRTVQYYYSTCNIINPINTSYK